MCADNILITDDGENSYNNNIVLCKGQLLISIVSSIIIKTIEFIHITTTVATVTLPLQCGRTLISTPATSSTPTQRPQWYISLWPTRICGMCTFFFNEPLQHQSMSQWNILTLTQYHSATCSILIQVSS